MRPNLGYFFFVKCSVPKYLSFLSRHTAVKCGSRSLCSASLLLRLGTSITFLHTSYSPPDNFCRAGRQLLCASYHSLLESIGARCCDCGLGPVPELRSSRGAKRKLLASSRNRIQVLETDDPLVVMLASIVRMKDLVSREKGSL